MSNRTIFDALIAAHLTPEGACGLMGNMMAESAMKSNIAQRGMTTMTDEQYTAAADNGTINFTNDSVGYGLCQWTFNTRKAALLAFARNKGVSVGDETMQVQFCLRELQQDYPMVFLLLCSSHDIDECTDRVCDKYERPAVNNYPARRQFAREFFNEFCGSGALSQEHAILNQTETPKPESSNVGKKIAVIFMQMIMHYCGYWGDATGEVNAEFISAAHTFVEDMAK